MQPKYRTTQVTNQGFSTSIMLAPVRKITEPLLAMKGSIPDRETDLFEWSIISPKIRNTCEIKENLPGETETLR